MSLSHITLHLTVAKPVSVFRSVGRKKLVGGCVLSKLRKHSAKIFFGVSCFLLALSLGFSAYSFAKYVSHVDLDSDGARQGTDCRAGAERKFPAHRPRRRGFPLCRFVEKEIIFRSRRLSASGFFYSDSINFHPRGNNRSYKRKRFVPYEKKIICLTCLFFRSDADICKRMCTY